MFTVRQIIEKTIEKRREVFVEFIELEKAYDSVISVQLWVAFRRGEVGERLVSAIQSLYEGCEARVKEWERYSEWFEVDQVVKQGCTLLPWLLNGILDTL